MSGKTMLFVVLAAAYYVALICKVELLVGKASARFRGETRDERRADPALPALTGALHRKSAAPIR